MHENERSEFGNQEPRKKELRKARVAKVGIRKAGNRIRKRKKK
jgi:hypothetical protein